MRFAWKVFFSVIIVVVLSISTTGYILSASSFNNALMQEKQKVMDRISMFAVIVETMSSDYTATPDPSELVTIMESVTTGDFQNMYLYDQSGIRIYPVSSEDNDISADLLEKAKQGTAYQIIAAPDKPKESRIYIMVVVMAVQLGTTTGFLSMSSDVSAPFSLYDNLAHISVFSILLVILIVGALLIVICTMLTRPIRKLSIVTRQLAQGSYDMRTDVKTNDEIGDLSNDFNAMADSLEATMQRLSSEATQRENFVTSFAHELKTPLTSIIGYADIIRSQRIDEENLVSCANYIFTEGRRLERLSLKLLELMVLNRQQFDKFDIKIGHLSRRLIEWTEPILHEQYNVKICVDMPDATIHVEPDLLQTMIANLIINAVKASNPGQTVNVTGECRDSGYLLCVSDKGIGISKEELPHITEAFYTVDKSRARAQNGAGLGLALCVAIAKLHDTELDFKSEVSKGTTVSFLMPYGKDDGNGKE